MHVKSTQRMAHASAASRVGGPRRQIPVETPVAWTQWGRTFGVEDVRARPQTATNALESGWRERTGAE